MPVGTEKRYLRFSAILTDRPIISSALKKTGLPERLVVYHNGTAVIERSGGTENEGGRRKGEAGKCSLTSIGPLQFRVNCYQNSPLFFRLPPSAFPPSRYPRFPLLYPHAFIQEKVPGCDSSGRENPNGSLVEILPDARRAA